MVVPIAILSKTRHYYLAVLIPLFSTFALLAHFIVASERGTDALRTTIIFGMWAILPYFVYLLSLCCCSCMLRYWLPFHAGG